uniref:Coat protein n=1 Tax=Ceratobasidium partitivirus CP-a1 TaxID=1970086 RepID=A0A219WGJ7_9VIRU|nr:coat protein [Ceratobasidium partitivirus CP-a1]
MSTAKSVAVRAAALKSKAVTVEASVSKVPDPSINFLDTFMANSSARTDHSNEFTIDVFPDSIPTTCYIMSLMSKYMDDIDQKKHGKASLPTMVFYSMSLYYGFFLLNDMYVRPTHSEYADPWHKNEHMKSFADFLGSLPVPEGLMTIFEELFAAEHERRKNVHFVPSMAGYSYHHYHGKFIPPMMFINAHNTMCDVAATTKGDIMLDFLKRPIYSITTMKSNQTYAYTAQALDFLGGTTDGTTGAKFANTKWFQYFETIFNPVIFRSYQRRDYLAEIPLSPPKFAHPRKVNPYHLIYAPTKQNLVEQKTVLQALAGIMKGSVPFSKTLVDIISSGSGIAIIRHGYSEMSLPLITHDLSNLSSVTKYTKQSKIDAEDFANAIKFLVIPTKPTTKTAPTMPRVEKDDGTPVTTGYKISRLFSSPYFRVDDAPSTDELPADSDFVTFKETEHLYPKVYVMDILGTTTVDAYKATLTGKVIESFDIDGSTVGQPNIRTALGQENSLFFDSAIPFNMVYRRTHFVETALFTHEAVALRRTKADRQSRHPASSILVDRTKVIIPKFNQQTNDSHGPGNPFVGLTQAAHVSWYQFALRFIGFKSPDATSNPYPEIPGRNNRRLIAWSPYVFVAAQDEDSFEEPDAALTRRFFIMNLRTIVGSTIPLVEVKNAIECLPVP